MFSIFSKPTDPTAPTLHPVTSAFQPSELFGELEPEDISWLCAKGFVTETQTFYTIADDGLFVTCQVIYSSVGPLFPQIQFTTKVFNPATQERTWKSVNVSNFVTPPPGQGMDKRSSKADEYSVIYKSKPGTENPESFTISANLSKDIQVSLDFVRPAGVPGFKVGNGPKGGYTYFGGNIDKPDGYCIHRFWPSTSVSGAVILKGQVLSITGRGMFVHAIQGMRPDNLAWRWNFAHFQSKAHNGVSAVQMEFTTNPPHGRKGAGSGKVKVNVGAIEVGGKLAAISAETKWSDEEPPAEAEAEVVSRCTHSRTENDPEVGGYAKPGLLEWSWKGPSILAESPGSVSAQLKLETGDLKNPRGLVEKVDVMAEIPRVVKMAVSYVSGTKPYMYQWLNPATLHVTGPDTLIDGLSKGLDVEGVVYNEATFISD